MVLALFWKRISWNLYLVHELKILHSTTGSVIGKGGANISELQKEYSVHIRMSKANDVFPGL